MSEDRRCANCANCANWRPTLEAVVGTPLTVLGECHRYAPRPVVVTEEALTAANIVWPMTQADDGCGEWFHGADHLRRTGQPKAAGPAAGAQAP